MTAATVLKPDTEGKYFKRTGPPLAVGQIIYLEPDMKEIELTLCHEQTHKGVRFMAWAGLDRTTGLYHPIVEFFPQ